MKNLLCKNTITIGKFAFKENEQYYGKQINEHWWCVDAVGIKTEDVKDNFVMMSNEKEKEELEDIVTGG